MNLWSKLFIDTHIFGFGDQSDLKERLLRYSSQSIPQNQRAIFYRIQDCRASFSLSNANKSAERERGDI